MLAVWSMLPARSAPLAFGSPSLPLPSSNARHPASAPARCARPRPPFGASKPQSGCSIHRLSCMSRFRMIDGASCMVYVACPLRPTRLRLALFATTVLQRPAPATAPARCARPRPPPTSQLETSPKLRVETGGRILYHAVL